MPRTPESRSDVPSTPVTTHATTPPIAPRDRRRPQTRDSAKTEGTPNAPKGITEASIESE
ncbi:MAG: hypothetical protein IT371_30320 [Deltaproteobacteria bacterium]|nr:hypothetical protein [Deltaproteobacteria bacterium]